MTVLTWCGNKIRNAYEMCKRALCFWTTVGDDESINDNYDVQNRYINEIDNSTRQATPSTGYSQHRRRPDIPTVKWRPVDPSVYEACKELRVPVGDNDKRLTSEDEDDDDDAETPQNPELLPETEKAVV